MKKDGFLKFSLAVFILIVLSAAAIFIVYREKILPKILKMSERKTDETIYFCPMHPTYTSDRPGDCSICYMKLEKREMTPVSVFSHESKGLKDICYMHNCPMVHDGKPCPMLVVATMGEAVTCPVCGTHVSEGKPMTERKVLYWTDPMTSDYRSDKPGKSPMGMDLVPVYEESASTVGEPGVLPAGYAPILVSLQKQQIIGVKTTSVEKKSFTKTIRTVGRVMVDETRIARVNPKVEGWVEEIFAKYEGDKVQKGQPLFSFYSPDFVSAQEEYLTTLSFLKELPSDVSRETLATSEANVKSAKRRLIWWDISEEQIKRIENEGKPEKNLLIISPIDGVVLKKNVFPGQFMERGADFYQLADLSTIWVDADLYEYDLPLVQVGQEALVSLPATEKVQFRGKVIYVAPYLKPETRTATARLEFSNSGNVLRPEMYVNVQILVDLGKKLLVPAEAVLDTGARKIIFVSKGNGIFEPREVTVGVKGDGVLEIKNGVVEGEVVVTSGNFLIDSESRLKSAIEGMGHSSSAGHDHGQSGEMGVEQKRETISSTEQAGEHRHGH
jgi:Cu(I)/Ag(I) efflux system membrane fusion protein/cobalt-zinc-cadmium efflux system membrane fusion protein